MAGWLGYMLNTRSRGLDSDTLALNNCPPFQSLALLFYASQRCASTSVSKHATHAVTAVVFVIFIVVHVNF